MGVDFIVRYNVLIEYNNIWLENAKPCANRANVAANPPDIVVIELGALGNYKCMCKCKKHT